MYNSCGINPTRPYLNLKWSIADMDKMRFMWRANISPEAIASYFNEPERQVTGAEIWKIAERNEFEGPEK